jgi:hypothetical protein
MKKNLFFGLTVVATLVLGTFATLPAAVRAQAVDPVLVGAGDIVTCGGTHDDDTAKLLDGIDGTVFTLGDNVYPDGAPAQFSDCYAATWGRHKARTMPAPGNHDYHTTGAAGYYGYFGQAASPLDNNCASDCRGYYSYDLGAWHILVLNSETTFTSGSPQEKWMRADLAANQNVCTLAYWHEPLFSSGMHGNSNRVLPLWQVLYEYGADVVLNGHDHLYERFAPQNPKGVADAKGIREFVVGTGGASLYSFTAIQPNSEARNNSAWGVLKLTLHSTSYDWQFVPAAGQTYTDSGSADCVGAGAGTPATRTPTSSAPGATATVAPTKNATATPNSPVPSATPTLAPANTPTARPTSLPGPKDVIFADSFETGDLSGWSASVPDAGDLKVNARAALKGSRGLRILIDDNRAIYVTDGRPASERRYRARFYFDPNSIKMANGDGHFLFNGLKGSATSVLRVEFRRSAATYQVRAMLLKDDLTWAPTRWNPISDAKHFIELDWRAATAAGANNGGLALWIDGILKANLKGVDNDTRRVDLVRLGATGGIDTGTRGAYYLDAFVSRRKTYIGQLP